MEELLVTSSVLNVRGKEVYKVKHTIVMFVVYQKKPAGNGISDCVGWNNHKCYCDFETKDDQNFNILTKSYCIDLNHIGQLCLLLWFGSLWEATRTTTNKIEFIGHIHQGNKSS